MHYMKTHSVVNCHMISAQHLCAHISEGRLDGTRKWRWGDDIEDCTGKTLAEYKTVARDRKSWRELVYPSTVSNDLQQLKRRDVDDDTELNIDLHARKPSMPGVGILFNSRATWNILIVSSQVDCYNMGKKSYCSLVTHVILAIFMSNLYSRMPGTTQIDKSHARKFVGHINRPQLVLSHKQRGQNTPHSRKELTPLPMQHK